MKLHTLTSICIALIILLAAPSLLFGNLVIPPGLDIGDTYRIVFVTSYTTTATSSNISYYNGFVNDVANNLGAYTGSILAPLGTTWTAIASTYTVNAFDNIGGTFSNNVYLLDGTLVAAGSAGLWGGTLSHAINLTQIDTVLSSNFVWTGSYASGVARYGLGDTFGSASAGRTANADNGWADYTVAGTGNTLRLYGISAELTVPGDSIPEPGTLATMVGGLVLLGLAERRRRTRHARTNLQT